MAASLQSLSVVGTGAENLTGEIEARAPMLPAIAFATQVSAENHSDPFG
jgi:hypothetical protein